MTRHDKPEAAGLGQQRGRSLADVAFEAIEEMIVTRRLAPGAMLSENELAADLAMGRTPVREALARLEWMGFVEIHPRRGVQVSSVDVIRHLELLEVRLPLEAAIVRHAVERATDEDCAELRSIARELADAADEKNRDRYFRAKRRLHEVEVRAAYNHVLVQTMRNLHAQSRRFWFTYEPTESFAEASQLHAAVVDHINRRDAEAAVAGVERLFEFLVRLTKSALDRRPLR